MMRAVGQKQNNCAEISTKLQCHYIQPSNLSSALSFLFSGFFFQNNVTSLKRIVNIRKKKLNFVFGSGEQLILYAFHVRANEN